jgi:uncharacterized NAD(P)/FAD-binding protein YdhS
MQRVECNRSPICGAFLACLTQAATNPFQLAVVVVAHELAERRLIELGRGIAYSTDDPGHLLNVRVANMSAFADRPDHLSQWLQNKGPSVARLTPLCFISRSIYGTYMADMVQELRGSGAVRHVRGRCIDLVQIGDEVKGSKPAARSLPTWQFWRRAMIQNPL